MKKFVLLAMLAGALSACSQQDSTEPEPEDLKGENSVTLSVLQAPQTKSISDQKGNPEYAVIGSGKLYFINSSGNSIYQRELTATEIATLANTSSTPGNKTITITGIPNTATTLYFMANIRTSAASSYPLVEGTTSADARLRIDRLQADAIHVPMAGQSTTFTAGSGTNQYTASVTLTPIVARVELGQVTCQNQNGAGQPAVSTDILSYKLSGVFMNNIRGYVMLSGAPYLVGSPIDIKSQSGWASGFANYFMPFNSSFPYYVGGNPNAPSDWVANSMVNYCNPTASGLTFYPDPTNGSTNTDPALTIKKAWAYQVAPSTTVPSGTPADVPHLILKLTDVTYSDNPLGLTTQYITVSKFKDGSGNPVTEFKRGNVYRIENLIFTSNEATNQPYEKNITVTATVSVAPWIINTVTPDWE